MTEDLKQYIDGLPINEFRLLNGDHIIAEILYESATDITLSDPAMIEQTPSGIPYINHWFPYTNSKYFVIDKKHVIAMGDVTFQYKIMYNKLVLANKIKQRVNEGDVQDPFELDLLNELTNMSTSTSPQQSSYEEELPPDWADLVDTSKVQ